MRQAHEGGKRPRLFLVCLARQKIKIRFSSGVRCGEGGNAWHTSVSMWCVGRGGGRRKLGHGCPWGGGANIATGNPKYNGHGCLSVFLFFVWQNEYKLRAEMKWGNGWQRVIRETLHYFMQGYSIYTGTERHLSALYIVGGQTQQQNLILKVCRRQ